MGRTEYLAELESRLQSLPDDERRSALSYYEEYFNEAGEQRERNAIDELGSPAKVAAQILSDLSHSGTAHVRTKRKLSTLAVITAGIFAIPVGLPLAFAGFIVLLALVVCAFAIVLSLGVAFLALIFTGGSVIYSGLTLLSASFVSACIYFGIGCILIGISMFFYIGARFAAKYLLSGVLRVASGIFNNLKGRVAA